MGVRSRFVFTRCAVTMISSSAPEGAPVPPTTELAEDGGGWSAPNAGNAVINIAADKTKSSERIERKNMNPPPAICFSTDNCQQDDLLANHTLPYLYEITQSAKTQVTLRGFKVCAFCLLEHREALLREFQTAQDKVRKVPAIKSLNGGAFACRPRPKAGTRIRSLLSTVNRPREMLDILEEAADACSGTPIPLAHYRILCHTTHFVNTVPPRLKERYTM